MISNSMAASWGELPRSQRMRVAGLLGYVVLMTLFFMEPLARLFMHARANSLHSHILLVPFIAAYLLYIQPGVRFAAYRTSMSGALAAGAIGAAALAAGTIAGNRLSTNDYLALMTLAYATLVAAGAFVFFGAGWMRAAAFPMAFLVFMIPLPDPIVSWLEMASVWASADTAALLFTMTGTPLLREGTLFALPGVVLEVARECSGIRSSWVLFITSVLAAHMLLASRWRRAVLIAFVIPLAIARNAVRIVTIGLLAVHVGPHMMESAIHRRGGPLFFALSLVPLFLLLWWLWRQERRRPLGG